MKKLAKTLWSLVLVAAFFAAWFTIGNLIWQIMLIASAIAIIGVIIIYLIN